MAVQKKITVLDLFAGCGGLTEGFEKTGDYKFVGAVEWEKPFCDTLSNRLKTKWGVNDADDRVIQFDIQNLEQLFEGWEDDPKFGSNIGLDGLIAKENGLDLIVGGPPCQAYSIAGRVRDANGMHEDYRNYLFESYVKIVERYKPNAFVFENVLGMLSAKPGGISIIERIFKSFGDIGYLISDDLRKQAVFNTADFGVPQNRRRVIIYGVKKATNKKPQKVIDDFYERLNELKSKKKNVKQAIGDLDTFYPIKGGPKKENGKKFSHAPTSTKNRWHYPRFHSERDIKIFNVLAADIRNGTNQYPTVEHMKELYTKLTGKSSNVHKYYVLREDQPSNTIPAHLHKDGLRHIHPDPEQARTISVREAARLQTFPDTFDFIGSQSDAYKMIGNAVPPLFAEKIGIAASADFV